MSRLVQQVYRAIKFRDIKFKPIDGGCVLKWIDSRFLDSMKIEWKVGVFVWPSFLRLVWGIVVRNPDRVLGQTGRAVFSKLLNQKDRCVFKRLGHSK